jgi:hypothetical protein
MTYSLRVREVVRWRDFNEFESEVRGELDGHPVTCYVLAAPVEGWDCYLVGATVEVDAWIERSTVPVRS